MIENPRASDVHASLNNSHAQAKAIYTFQLPAVMFNQPRPFRDGLSIVYVSRFPIGNNAGTGNSVHTSYRSEGSNRDFPSGAVAETVHGRHVPEIMPEGREGVGYEVTVYQTEKCFT